MAAETTVKTRQQKVLRNVRRVVWLGVLSGIAYFCLRYDVITIPADYDLLAPQHMGPGAKVVTQSFDPEETELGQVVLYRAPGPHEGNCFGVIVGLPGEWLKVESDERGAGTLEVGDRREKLPLPAGHKLQSGVIPEGHFLILNGDRKFSADVLKPDSRIHGYVPAANIDRQLVVALNPFQ